MAPIPNPTDGRSSDRVRLAPATLHNSGLKRKTYAASSETSPRAINSASQTDPDRTCVRTDSHEHRRR